MAVTKENLIALSEFAEIAQEYCDFIDSLKNGKPDDLYRRLERLLTKLHITILPVQKDHAENKDPEFKDLELKTEDFMILLRHLKSLLESESSALKEWNLKLYKNKEIAEKYSDAVMRSATLDCDLAEIYQDIYSGLARWKIGTDDAIADAAWEWRFHFEAHWGDHLFGAMQSVHEILYHILDDD